MEEPEFFQHKPLVDFLGKNPLPSKKRGPAQRDEEAVVLEEDEEADMLLVDIENLIFEPLQVSLPSKTDMATLAQVQRAFVMLRRLEALPVKPKYLRIFSPLPEKDGFAPVHIRLNTDSLLTLILDNDELDVSDLLQFCPRMIDARNMDLLPKRMLQRVKKEIDDALDQELISVETFDTVTLFTIAKECLQSVQQGGARSATPIDDTTESNMSTKVTLFY